MNSKTKKVLVPLVAIVFGFLLGAIIMLAFGYNPIWGYEDLFISALGNTRAIGETLQTMGPLILTALSFAVAMKVGLFNIGMSGQALAGWISSMWFALSFPDIPRLLMIPLVVIIECSSEHLWDSYQVFFVLSLEHQKLSPQSC